MKAVNQWNHPLQFLDKRYPNRAQVSPSLTLVWKNDGRIHPSVGQGFSRLVPLHLRNIFGRAFEAYFFLEISLVPRAICRRSIEKRFPISTQRAPQMATRAPPQDLEILVAPNFLRPILSSSKEQENCNVVSELEKSQPLDRSGGARQFSPIIMGSWEMRRREGVKFSKISGMVC